MGRLGRRPGAGRGGPRAERWRSLRALSGRGAALPLRPSPAASCARSPGGQAAPHRPEVRAGGRKLVETWLRAGILNLRLKVFLIALSVCGETSSSRVLDFE